MMLVDMGQHHSDEERAACLAALSANGGNIAKTARECGVSRQTLQRWVREQAQVNDETGIKRAPKKASAQHVAELLPDARETLEAKLEALAHKILAVIPGRLDEANLSQLSVALGVTVDKLALLRIKLPPSEELEERPVREIVVSTREEAATLLPLLSQAGGLPERD
jgi:transposase-like protein